MTAQQDIFNLIKQLTGQKNILTIPRAFIKFTGSVDAALLLSQIIYWSDRNPDGPWFFKSYKDWEDEIGLSKHKISRAIGILQGKGVLKTKTKKANGNPTLHYLFRADPLIQWFSPFLTNESEKRGNPIKHKLLHKAETPFTQDDFTIFDQDERKADALEQFKANVNRVVPTKPHKKSSRDKPSIHPG